MNEENEFILCADFELHESNNYLNADLLKIHPELRSQFLLIDAYYNTTYIINESIYNYLQLFLTPVTPESIYTQLQVTGTSKQQVQSFTEDLMEQHIIIPATENALLKEQIEKEKTPTHIDIDQSSLRKVLKHTSNIWIGVVETDIRPEPYVLKKLLLPDYLLAETRQRKIQDFLHEIAMHSAAGSHPSIVPLYKSDTTNYEIEMGFVEGKSIRKFVQENNPPLQEKLSSITKILDIFTYLHEQNVLHGDIHSSNFLVQKDGNPVLLDFDMALTTQSNGSTEGRTGGVYSYAPPERISTEPMHIFNKKVVDMTAEVYQLGIIFYQVLYHKLPFGGTTWKALSGNILTLPPQWTPETPRGESITTAVIQVLEKSLNKDPNNRYESVQAFAKAWYQALSSS